MQGVHTDNIETHSKVQRARPASVGAQPCTGQAQAAPALVEACVDADGNVVLDDNLTYMVMEYAGR